MPGGPHDRFNAAARAQARRLPAIQREHVRAIVLELERAQARIRRLIRSSPTAASTAHWQRVARQIDEQLGRFRTAAAATSTAGIEAALGAGRELVTGPLAAAGFPQLGPEFRLNPRALTALRASAIDRIRDVTDQARGRIRSALSQVMLGTLRLDQAVALVDRALGGNARRRAMTIAYTEIGRAYSVASFESFQRAEQLGVKFARMWRQSGKAHPRKSHVNAHGQMVRGTAPFVIVDVKTSESEELRFPRDPAASAYNTINCGCIDIPVVDGSSFDTIDPKTGELRRRVVSLPDDPTAPPVLVTQADRDRANREYLERFNQRMRNLGLGTTPTGQGGAAALAPATPPPTPPPTTPGLAVSTGDALLAARVNVQAETQIALWWRKPRGEVSAGMLSRVVERSTSARAPDAWMTPYFRKKQLQRHPDLSAADYARLPLLLQQYRVVVRDGESDVVVIEDGASILVVVIRSDRAGRALVRSMRRVRPARLKRLRTLHVIDGDWSWLK